MALAAPRQSEEKIASTNSARERNGFDLWDKPHTDGHFDLFAAKDSSEMDGFNLWDRPRNDGHFKLFD